MAGVWDIIKTTPPVVRALIIGGLSYFVVEMFKPGFAFADVGGGNYIPRSFKEDQIINEDEDMIVKGTTFPWWSVPLGLFVIFSLFV